MCIRQVIQVTQSHILWRGTRRNTSNQVQMIGQHRKPRKPVPIFFRNTKYHIPTTAKIFIADQRPAAIMNQYQVEIVKIGAVCRAPVLSQIDIVKLQLKLLSSPLHTRITHPMVTQLRRNVLFHDFSPGISHSSQQKIPAKRLRNGRAYQVLLSSLYGFHDRGRIHHRPS